MKTPKLLTALAALTSAFALSACGNDKAAEQPQAEAQIEQPRMVVFLRMEQTERGPACMFSHLMKTEMDAAQAANPAALNGITAIDVSTPEGYAVAQNYTVDGQSITQAPAMVILRGNQIIDGQIGQMHIDQLQQRLQAAQRNHFARDTRIPQAARITLGS